MKKGFSLVSVDDIPFRVFYTLAEYPLAETSGKPTAELELTRITHGGQDHDLLPLLSEDTLSLIESKILDEIHQAMLEPSEE